MVRISISPYLFQTHFVIIGSETWIPTIKRLFQLQSHSLSTVRIAQIWVVDAQNHGDAAVLNDQVLKDKFSDHGV